MAYQETSRQSYGSKVKGSFQGILWGIILIIAGTIVLWWNEGRAVKTSNALKDFQKNYVEMSDINTLDPALEGKAVHATGVAVTTDTLRDAAFGIVVNAFRLTRDVEYYQWTENSASEKKDKLGGSTETTTTYTYKQAWCDSPVNSDEFKDPDYKGKNSVWRVVDDAEQLAANASFGAYRLPQGIINGISGDEPVEPALSEAQQQALLAKVADSTVVVTIRGNQVYIGADPDTPHIGDVRITFNQVTSPKTISLLQKVVNGTFENYIAKNGKSFSKVEMGTVSAVNMIEHQKSANKIILWLFRILGIILVVAGFRSLLGFISTVFAVVPFVQRIIGAGLGLVTTVVGLVWSLVVIALAWVANRPVLGIALLVIAVALIVWLVGRSRKKKLNNIAALLAVILMAGLTGCTGGANQPDGGGDGTAVAASVVKGPVQTVKVTQFYGEGEPGTTIYHYDENGKMVGEEEEEFDYEGDDYELIESLSEKDAEGRYTKEVWGSDGEPDQFTTHEYNERGQVVRSESRRFDGTWNYTNENVYDADGHLIETINRSSYGESRNTYEYDGDGRQKASSYYSNGALYSTTENKYDENGLLCYSRDNFVQMDRINEHYMSYDKEGELIANRTYVTDSEGFRLQDSDTVFFDAKGFRHERQFNSYDNNAKTYEGTFNKDHYLTHYEYFEGNSTNPSFIVDFNYEKDGQTLRDLTWKDLSLGTVKNTLTRSFNTRYDTFGNWTRRTNGLPYLFDGTYTKFDDLEGLLTETIREITYRGDDQGNNYGFEGKAGNATVQLACTEDDGVLYGDLTIDGNRYQTVGKRDNEDNLFFVALQNAEGEIPWSLSIPAGNGKRNATLFHEGEEIPATLAPTRKDLRTYCFSASADDLVGLYEYSFTDGTTSGKLDVYRSGENWQDIHFEIENIWYGSLSPKTASDEAIDFLGDRTEFFVYRWSDETEAQLEYKIRFFDGFAVIEILKGNPNNFFPIGTTIAGIYAKLPAVG